MHEMVKKRGKPNDRMQAWIDARKRHGLSHAEVQMARELGMNPQKLGKLDNHHQEPWNAASSVHPAPLLQAIWQGTARHDPNNRGKVSPRPGKEGDQARS